MAGVLGRRGVRVQLNGATLPVATFADYVALYADAGAAGAPAPARAWERVNDRWEVCIAPSDGAAGKMGSVCEQLRARGGRLILLLDDAQGPIARAALADAGGQAARLLVVPKVVDCLQPIVNVIPLQLLAYHLTVVRGHNVDRAPPARPLSRSVLTRARRAAQPGKVRHCGGLRGESDAYELKEAGARLCRASGG
jgi:hypothetical protein